MTTRQKKNNHNYDARSAARIWAVQALYQMDIAGTQLEKIIAEFDGHRFDLPDEDICLPPADRPYFETILRGVVAQQKRIDQSISAALRQDWTLSRLDSTLRALLRAGTFEVLSDDYNVPPNVILSEYTDMAYGFCDKTEAGLVNAVLDRLLKERMQENRS